MKRRLNLPCDIERVRNIEEMRVIAQRRVPHFAFEYVRGGAEDEKTMAANRAVFDQWQWLPDALVATPKRDLSARVFDLPLRAPVIIAPTGYNGMLHRHADMALAQAAAQRELAMVQSTVSNDAIEDVASVAQGRHWFQLYMLRDRAITEDLLARAWAAGCRVLVLTSDAIHFGNREWDQRSFRRPMKLHWRTFLDCALHPRWAANVMLPHGVPSFGNLKRYLPPGKHSAMGGAIYFAQQMDTEISWDTFAWLRERWQGALVLKGVITPADALRAREAGANGIVLTNHGGRQLDGCISPLLMLPEVRAALGADFPILVDSGYRRGTDIAKALCLGASAVLVGRPVLYGVGAGGLAGAGRALDILLTELDRTLAQLGCASVADLSPRFLRQAGASIPA